MMPAKPAPEFLWGVATSAAQIEGAVQEAGRGESIWDRFAATPGRIEDGSTPAVACDHYHRWQEDLDRLVDLGVDAYRFSIAWPRILPRGRGAVNQAGLEFYDRLVDGLLERGIQPFPTLYHWDLPQALQDEGGWASRSVVDAFVEFTRVVASRLGDRVTHWVTHNEPWCSATLGYEQGIHAPGVMDPAAGLAAAHHLLLSHGYATKVLRDRSPGCEVGIVLNLTPAVAATDTPGDEDAARWFDGYFNRWYLDPLFHGRYPEDSIADRVARGHLPENELPFVMPGDLNIISRPLDFLGVNYYSRAVMRAGEDGRAVGVTPAADTPLTDMGWELYPDGLERLLLRLHDEYAPKAMYITENGAAYKDAPDAAGRVADSRRIEYHETHIAAVQRARTSGVPVHGYFAWSFLDNFEWAHGYDRRFGLYWVDFETGKRIPKDSAFWFRDFIRRGSLVPETGSPR